MPWTTLTLEVTTPLFNGGADVESSDGTGVRVSSLRGAMRWWFRALAGSVTGPDLGLLWRVERAVFGGRGGEGGDAPSPLRLRIPAQPSLTSPFARHDFLRPSPRRSLSAEERARQPGYWIIYLLGQGLGDLGSRALRRPYVAPGETFDLKFRFDGDERRAALALAALWLTCAYGGVGARIRRGFGGLRIIDSIGPLPEPWTPDSVRTPGLEHYTGLQCLWPLSAPISICMPHLIALIRQEGGDPVPDAWTAQPPFPVMSRKYTLAGLSRGRSFEKWDQLLDVVGREFRCFRAGDECPEVKDRYWPLRKTSGWKNVVHGDDKKFPLGALGLPVLYKDGYRVNVWGKEEQRRASSLWLRPVGSPKQLQLFSFAFLGEFLPGVNASHGLSVQLRKKDRDATEGGRSRLLRTLQVTADDVRDIAESWIELSAELGG